MATTIRYIYSADSTDRWDEWTGDRTAAIEAACEALDARGTPEGYAHDDIDVGECVESEAAMAALGAALLAGHDLGTVYSVWCATAW